MIGLITLASCKNNEAPASVNVLEMHRATLTEEGFCAKQVGPGLSDAGTPLPIELIFPETGDDSHVVIRDQSTAIQHQQMGQRKVTRQ